MNDAAPALPRPASTVVVCRPQEGGGFEIYLVKRHGRSGFMAGAHVFPGGRVDDADHAVAAAFSPALLSAARAMLDGLDAVTAAAFCVAAVRETAEECGLLLARTETGAFVKPAVADVVVDAMRTGRGFADALRDHALVPDVAALHSFAWWITPKEEPKRFDTRFFLAPAPVGQLPRVDRHEATEGDWFSPAAALAAYADGRIQLAPPTLATLEDLTDAPSVEVAAASVRRPLPPIEPALITGEEGLVLALPGDALHDVAAAVSERRTRIVMGTDGRFVSQIAR